MPKSRWTVPAPWKVCWSPVNQAWFVMWGESVLKIANTSEEVTDFLREAGEVQP